MAAAFRQEQGWMTWLRVLREKSITIHFGQWPIPISNEEALFLHDLLMLPYSSVITTSKYSMTASAEIPEGDLTQVRFHSCSP
ncbi:hypothetical protein RIF29_14013 [Crotalaria pallida]|uniref:Uncharacterized protein n=1 Tax=Crotalaria pallida TaxID=3830 RepID=A0AAN9FGR2_CROPI